MSSANQHPEMAAAAGSEAATVTGDGEHGALVTPRAHQREALAALERTLTRHRRAQLIMACGTGKTLVGCWWAERCHAALTVVVVPSLALVTQTLAEWRSARGWTFEALIACSDPSTAEDEWGRTRTSAQADAPWWAQLRARVSTSPAVLAARVAHRSPRRPIVIFSTYHSVSVVVEAVQACGMVADLLVADEAHTLAGWSSEGFRAVFGDGFVRSRLFMTATPVTTDARHGGLSMRDEAVFGPVAYTLDFAAAIRRQLLADYRVMVYESPGHQQSPDPVAAVIKAAEQGVSRVLSFHSRVYRARRFAEAVDGLRLADGRTVVARTVAGSDPARRRAEALSLLRSAGCGELVVIASARCLGAGVDIPSVDGVLFADPKYSDVDVVQAVGRILRRSAGKETGVVLIPVVIPAGVDDDTVLSTGSFRAVWRILRGLRSMDERFAVELAAGTGRPSQGQNGRPVGRRLLDVDVWSLRDSDGIHARLVDLSSRTWEDSLAELHRYVTGHGHLPARSTSLGQWCEGQRRAYRWGTLAADRTVRLHDVPGWVWDISGHRWEDQCRQVRDLATAQGGLRLDCPQIARTVLRDSARGSSVGTVGRWCARQRRAHSQGRLDGWQIQQLEDISGWNWNPLSSRDAAALNLLAEYVAWKGHANPPADVVEDDLELGQWLAGVRRRRVTGTLTQTLLDEICVISPNTAAAGALQWHRSDTIWELHYAALQQFSVRHGHCRVPYSHHETLTDGSVEIYHWCAQQRKLWRHNALPQARIHMLETLAGWRWDTGHTKAELSARRSELVLADEARSHLVTLAAEVPHHEVIAKACGQPTALITSIVTGDRRRIPVTVDNQIRALTVAAVLLAAGPSTRVNAERSWRLIDDMLARGWPQLWLSRELGGRLHRPTQRPHTITVQRAEAIAGLHHRLGQRTFRAQQYRDLPPQLTEILGAQPSAREVA